jgi:(S)-2-hydroxy-acid oxidase
MTHDPVNLFEYEQRASEQMSLSQYDYVAGGATDEITLKRNRMAFDNLLLRSRNLVDVSKIDTSTTVLGSRINTPVMLAPAGFHTRAHPDGELATARAAAAVGTVMVLSSSSSFPLEEVAAGATGDKWAQQFLYSNRDLTLSMAKRAEDAGFKAITLTLDSPPRPPKRERNIRNRYSQTPSPNYVGLEISDYDWGSAARAQRGAGELIDASATWEYLDWLVERISLPIVAKGIMNAEDAQLCAEHGARAIIVSNHGARNLDTTPASIEVLPEIAAAVGDRLEVYLDSGVRRGTDVLKALALGARAVLIGRPLFWGLGVDGETGLTGVLNMLTDELELAMSMCGQTSVDAIDPRTVRTI